MDSNKTEFHKSLSSKFGKKASTTENKVISFVVVGAMVGIGIPILYEFFSDWADNTDMPTWLITAGPAFLGLGVLIIIVAMARSRK